MRSSPENTLLLADVSPQSHFPAEQSISLTNIEDGTSESSHETSDKTTDKTTLPPGWPRVPATLKEQMPSRALRLALPVSLTLLPVMSIGLVPYLTPPKHHNADTNPVLAVCIGKLHGSAQSPTGDTILQAANVVSTLWPIAFAAVVGAMLRTLALYKAEHGTTLGVWLPFSG